MNVSVTISLCGPFRYVIRLRVSVYPSVCDSYDEDLAQSDALVQDAGGRLTVNVFLLLFHYAAPSAMLLNYECQSVCPSVCDSYDEELAQSDVLVQDARGRLTVNVSLLLFHYAAPSAMLLDYECQSVCPSVCDSYDEELAQCDVLVQDARGTLAVNVSVTISLCGPLRYVTRLRVSVSLSVCL